MSAKYDPKTDPRVKYSDDGKSATIELDVAVSRGPKDPELMEVTVRRPTVGDLEAADLAKGNVGGSVLVVASITGLPAKVIRGMDADDFKRVSGVVEGFGGGNDPATGAES